MEQDIRQFREQLAVLLDGEIQHASALFNALESEHDSLAKMDDNLLQINNAGKQQLIENLQLATTGRIRLMQDHAYAATPEGVDRCIAETDANGLLTERFSKLSELARWCFQENRLIGQLINRRTQFITRALNSLTPGGNLQNPTYNEDGSRGNSQQFYRTVSI